MRVQTHRGGGIETEPGRIQQAIDPAISDRKVIGRVLGGGLRQRRGRHRIYSSRSGKDSPDIRRCQCGDSSRRIHVAHLAESQTRQRDRSHNGLLAGVTTSFIAVEEERFIFNNRPTDGAAKSVADQRRPWVSNITDLC